MIRTLATSSAIVLVLLAGTAGADVTPEEVWESWQAMSTAAGQELTVGGSARNGDTLEVTGITLTFKDELGGSAVATWDKLSFKDNGDGTVAVTMPDSFPLTLAFPAEGEGPGSIALTVTQPGMTITAGGSATETSYEFVAPVAALTLNEVKEKTGAVLETQGNIALSEVAAKYLVVRSETSTSIDTSFSAKALAVNVEGKDAAGSGQGKIVLSLADLNGTTKGNLLGADIMANMALALNSGFTMDTSFTFGGMSADFDILDATGPTKLTASATGGGFVLALNKDRMNYGTSLTGANIVASGPEIPFPQVQFGFGELGFNILMPVSKSDAPQDFAFLTKLVDFTVSEDIWGMFDPAGTLSHEPATIIIDTKGTGFWKQDIMDPSIDLDTIEAPGELSSLDLTLVQAKAAGADVSATGGLTFDNADLMTFQGVPRPDGKITFNIKGVNALIDNLVSMGLLPEEEVMGFRMMLGMFARPGAGPDELVSEVEFKDGGLFANGQQLQ